MESHAEEVVAKLAEHLEAINSRLSSIEQRLETQQASIDQLRASGIRNTVAKVHRSIEENLEDACGNQPSRPNALLGEVGKLTNGPDTNASKARRQSLGGAIFTTYCALYTALMVTSCFGLIPVFDWEVISLVEVELFGGWLAHNMALPFVISFGYIVVIFSIQHWMKSREAFGLRFPLAIWSLFLALFSLFGSLRTAPALFFLVRDKGLYHLVCGDSRTDWVLENPAGLWTMMFIVSKVPELIDTLFIVLRKRKLIVLHWYHHITVMTFCWHSWATYCMNGLVYSSMNLTVHALMYFFYFLTALGYRPTKFARMITVIQILQMLLGTTVTLYVNFHERFVVPRAFEWTVGEAPWHENVDFASSSECKVHPLNAFAGLMMYASYLWLFTVFFYNAYIRPKNTVTRTKKVD